MTFTIMISTRNRARDLQITCAQLQRLNPPPHEVLICADACQDDTLNILREHFPNFSVLQNHRPRGSIYSRDRMLRAARADIVLSLDDDSYPPNPQFLRDLEI